MFPFAATQTRPEKASRTRCRKFSTKSLANIGENFVWAELFLPEDERRYKAALLCHQPLRGPLDIFGRSLGRVHVRRSELRFDAHVGARPQRLVA